MKSENVQAQGYGSLTKGMTKQHLARSQRQRINVNALCVAFFLPWAFFCSIYALLSFNIRYSHPGVCWFLVISGFLVVVVICACALLAWQAKRRGDVEREPSWLIFTAISMIIALAAALVYGGINFDSNMNPHYDLRNMNTYTGVNPSAMRGTSLMDAATVTFVPEAKIDLRKSMGFENLDTYCVAPITITNSAGMVPLDTYDFWAVGVGCCSGNSADFHCGEYNNPTAKGGLRLMNDIQRNFFRLAVQQAEATYNIKAVHPLFFYWVKDPVLEMDAYRDEAFKYYFLGMIAHFAFQLLSTVLAVIGFSKMGHF